MNELEVKYGCNPNQKPSKIFMEDGSDLPIKVLNGKPGYINFLDAFNGWQLVKELKKATGLPAATSFNSRRLPMHTRGHVEQTGCLHLVILLHYRMCVMWQLPR